MRKSHESQVDLGCVHYCFSFSGQTAHCRGDYGDTAAAVLAHRENVGERLGQASKLASITRGG